jgi:hypothetical protein
MNYKLLLIAIASWLLVACDADLPSDDSPDDFSVETGSGRGLTQSEYENLSAVEKYQVATKLAAAVYKGIPVAEFFDVDSGLSDTTETGDNYLRDFRSAINTELDTETLDEVKAEIFGFDENGNPQEDLRKYQFSSGGQPKEEPYALVHDYPLSRDSFVSSMALFLANTIMFSCAEEMESTNVNDCQKTYTYLVSNIDQGQPISSIVRGYLPSIMNWRIGRSGQNVGVEGLEEFLGLFDRAEDADKVGIACQDVILLPEDQDYELSRTNFPNTEPQVILQEDTDGDGEGDSGGYFITNCDDFYNVIASHPLLMPRVCEVVSNYYLAGHDPEDRLALCDSILANGASTFEDLFKGIIFSREYLLNAERVRGFDEFAVPTLQALQWDVRMDAGGIDERIWRNMATNSRSRLYMGDMDWDTMTKKIGRDAEVPTDPLSFINYHNAMRDGILFRSRGWAGRRVTVGEEGDEEEVYIPGLLFVSDESVDPALDDDDQADNQIRPELAQLSPSEYLDFLFLTLAQRTPTEDERDELLALFGSEEVMGPDVNDEDDDGDSSEQIQINRNYWAIDNNTAQPTMRDWAWDDMARATFDYLTRLPSTYYFREINNEG